MLLQIFIVVCEKCIVHFGTPGSTNVWNRFNNKMKSPLRYTISDQS